MALKTRKRRSCLHTIIALSVLQRGESPVQLDVGHRHRHQWWFGDNSNTTAGRAGVM
jgi:hypothetical protein